MRSSAGIFKEAGGFLCSSSATAEADTIRAGLTACLERGCKKAELESDAKEILDMVTTGKTTEGIIHDIHILASQFESAVLKCSALSFVAAYAVKENGVVEWDGFEPSRLLKIISKRDVKYAKEN